MNYSCCYVLTDNQDLKYFNQMMISISSLRYVGFKDSVYVVMDSETALLINPRRNELSKLSAEIIVSEIEKGYTEKQKSRYLKTSLRKYIQGDSLFVDTDTIFVSCPPEWISDDDIAMVYDRNGLDDYTSYSRHKKKYEKCGLDCPENDQKFLNSGVIWMRDTDYVHSAFDKWHSFWKELLNRSGIPSDQVSLNYLWKHDEIKLKRLDDRYNVQIGQPYVSAKYLSTAIIFHYYNLSKVEATFLLNDPSIQKLDYRDERIQQIIHDPLSAVSDFRWIKKDSVTDEYVKTQSFQLGVAVLRKHQRILSIFEGFSKLLYRIRRIGSK